MSSNDLFLKTLQDDFMAALDAFYQQDSPLHRRNVVRAFGTAVEGETYHLKQHCLARLGLSPAFYTTGEAALLQEASFYLDHAFNVVARPQFLSPPEDFVFTLKAFAKDTLPALDLRGDGPAWANFKEAFRIRNRITHPKCEADLNVSDSAFGTVQRAFLWFEKALGEVQLASGLALHDRYDEVRRQLACLGLDPGAASGAEIIPRETLQAWAQRLKSLVIPPPR
jgi:hypothetical protein